MIFKIESEFTTDIQSKAVQEIRYFEDLSQAIEKIFDRLLLNKATLESTSGHSRFVQAGCNNTLCFLMNTLECIFRTKVLTFKSFPAFHSCGLFKALI